MSKILFINPDASECSFSGKLINALAKEAINNGHTCWIAAANGESAMQSVRTIPIQSYFGQTIHNFLAHNLDAMGLHSLRATNSLIESIVALRPDIVHIHSLAEAYIQVPLIMEFFKRSNIPVLVTMYDYWLVTGHCQQPDAAKCEKYKSATCSNCPLKTAQLPTRWDNSKRNIHIKTKMLANFDNLFIVANSEQMAQNLHQSWISEHPIYTVPLAQNDNNCSIFADELHKIVEQYMTIYQNLL